MHQLETIARTASPAGAARPRPTAPLANPSVRSVAKPTLTTVSENKRARTIFWSDYSIRHLPQSVTRASHGRHTARVSASRASHGRHTGVTPRGSAPAERHTGVIRASHGEGQRKQSVTRASYERHTADRSQQELRAGRQRVTGPC